MAGHRLIVTIDRETAALLAAYARETERSQAAVIRIALRAFFDTRHQLQEEGPRVETG